MRTFSCVPNSQSTPTGSHIYNGLMYRIHQAGEGGDLVKIQENTNKSTILQYKVSNLKHKNSKMFRLSLLGHPQGM